MRMLAIANELDGYERADAARLAGMWIKRCAMSSSASTLKGSMASTTGCARVAPRRLTPEQEAEIKAACSPVRHRESSIAPARRPRS
jgi:hypothetical protein